MDEISDILHRYLKGTMTPEDHQALDQWLCQSPENRRLFEQINDPDTLGSWLENMKQFNENRVWDTVMQSRQPQPAPIRKFPAKWAWAASLLLLVSAATYYFMVSERPTAQKNLQRIASTKDVEPGGNKAVLTLSDGSHIVLDSSSNRSLAQQGHTRVMKTDDGSIAYYAGDAKPEHMVFNSLQTPKGGQYHLTLSDGTKVWLNTASSIRYPVNFPGNERNVSVSGEVYFEVAHNPKAPFKVAVNDLAEVHVLGTRFNVKSYPEDSATYTTLLEGVVKMNEPYSEVLLKPGEQALLDQAMHQPIRILKNIDTERIIAWKNGKFDFEDKSLKEIMRELARWYDLKIVYSPALDNAEFGGDIPMNLNLSQVLKVLEGAGIHFKMENDKTLRVMP